MSEPLIRTHSPSANRDIAAGKLSAGLQNRPATVAMIQRIASAPIAEWHHPFSHPPAYFRAMRARQAWKTNRIRIENAYRTTRIATDSVARDFQTQYRLVFESGQFGTAALRGLTFGIEVGLATAGAAIAIATLAGAAAGSAALGIGAIAGAAAGCIAGVCAALWPQQRWDSREHMRAIMAAMSPVQRMVFLTNMRRLNTVARQADGMAPRAPWDIRNGDFQTVWGNPEQLTDWALDDIFAYPIFPTVNVPPTVSIEAMPESARYAIGCAISGLGANQRIGDARTLEHAAPHAGAWVQAHKELPAGSVKAAIAATRIHDFDVLPLGADVDAAFSAEEDRLEAAYAANAGTANSQESPINTLQVHNGA